MFSFLPLLQLPTEQPLLDALDRIGPILVDAEHSEQSPPFRDHFVLASPKSTVDEVIDWLNDGASKVVVSRQILRELSLSVAPDRLLLALDAGSFSSIPDSVRSAVSGVFLKVTSFDTDLISSIKSFFTSSDIYVLPSTFSPNVRAAKALGATIVIPTSHLTLGPSAPDVINVGDAFTAPLVSDRHDGLVPTLVTSFANHRSLGLVYSSFDTIKESIISGDGVYQSRKHGRWKKGETSGATQAVISIRVDCDMDALEFIVEQRGSGFCHLGTPSCFGTLAGLAALESTIVSRLASAPEGSYTSRLFKEPQLLANKIMEEAKELCEATTRDDVAFEAADLLYFTMVRCVSSGVGLAGIEASLDQKAKKVTRRRGDAKLQYIASPPKVNGVQHSEPQAPAPSPPPSSSKIAMRHADLTKCTTKERADLLKRPVLRSGEMIIKVKPIVEDVRNRGDVAILELTKKFDRADLTECLLRPPFYDLDTQKCLDGATPLDPKVKDAIDTAYDNVRRFHEAQLSPPLVVTTSPGVTCQRFARPIARVGLYVPGGTAVLPSTAYMLGIPAQVAGCKEIVIATPPLPSGSISPEVLYVAHKVGATAILKAGGAQAIAALAYGTETVPKVDKILGPGNQWVTAAKMLVQNDTDALVSIDMPAGPSEVLVIADHTANPAFVAIDLLSQAEHGVDSQVVLVAIDLQPEHLAEIEAQIDLQARALPRVEILKESISKSLLVKTKSLQEAFDFSNDYAPEHLILHLENASSNLPLVHNAGSVFIGPYTPESCGDYASGTNHTLPTNGYARQFSGVNTQTFQKHITAQEITAEGLRHIGPTVATLADCEGLGAHANAVRVRLVALSQA